jgi:tetratricopeptide (TPR) repeat protein
MRPAVYAFLFASAAFAAGQTTSDLLQQAISAHQKGDLASAARDYRLVLERRPRSVQVRINLGAALAGLGELDQAISVLSAAPDGDRDNPEIRLNLALAYHGKDDLPAAIKELELIPAGRRGDLRIVTLLADCYLRTGSPGKALSIIRPAITVHPDDADLNYQAGMALVRSGQTEKALDPLERAGRAGHNADAWLLAGATALDLGQVQRARDDLEIALKLNPKTPGILTWTGMARDRVSDEEGAKDAFRKALVENADDFEANLHLGAILYREREMGQAKPYLERAVALQPSSNLALYALALVRAGTGEVEKAVSDLERVVKMTPDWVEPHVKLAALYYRLNLDSKGEKERAAIEKLKSENRGQAVPLPALEGP